MGGLTGAMAADWVLNKAKQRHQQLENKSKEAQLAQPASQSAAAALAGTQIGTGGVGQVMNPLTGNAVAIDPTTAQAYDTVTGEVVDLSAIPGLGQGQDQDDDGEGDEEKQVGAQPGQDGAASVVQAAGVAPVQQQQAQPMPMPMLQPSPSRYVFTPQAVAQSQPNPQQQQAGVVLNQPGLSSPALAQPPIPGFNIAPATAQFTSGTLAGQAGGGVGHQASNVSGGAAVDGQGANAVGGRGRR
ncbi:uncharacterized protein PSFLO_04928 [Pseudozyma flocculosa]|nr:uncharacterized protein PSFLO_04928 [Pseudozyma flocculosa]